MRALVLLILISAAVPAPCFAQYAGYPGPGRPATYPNVSVQNNSYPRYGFRSYCNTSPRAYNQGMMGCANNNSFNSGFSGMTYNGEVYNTSRSTAAAEQLAQQVSAIWAQTPVAKMMSQPQQGMAQMQQNLSRPAPTMNGMLPPMSKKEMLRIFFEGGTPESTGGGQAPAPSGGPSNSSGVAYTNYQTAENEATKARNAAERVRGYDRDTWSRKNDASQAEYAANNANYAAQRAESAAFSSDGQARSYANLAREAANRARADANQARYNADTMR